MNWLNAFTDVVSREWAFGSKKGDQNKMKLGIKIKIQIKEHTLGR